MNDINITRPVNIQSATNLNKHIRTSHNTDEIHHHHLHWSGNTHAHGHHLLQIENLSISFEMYEQTDTLIQFFTAKKEERLVIENLNLSIHEGEIIALVGASGAGKTLLADALIGIFEPNAIVSGNIWFDGSLQNAESLAKLRGNSISIIPQSVNALDPLMKVGKQISSFADGEIDIDELFLRYNLDSSVKGMYPFELSGGMLRRILLCCALVGSPKVIIADEPTPGMDLELANKAIEDLRNHANAGAAILLITHDIELALEAANRIAVFKDGTIVEETSTDNFKSIETLNHPFSKKLFQAMPNHDWISAC